MKMIVKVGRARRRDWVLSFANGKKPLCKLFMVFISVDLHIDHKAYDMNWCHWHLG